MVFSLQPQLIAGFLFCDLPLLHMTHHSSKKQKIAHEITHGIEGPREITREGKRKPPPERGGGGRW